MQEPFIEADVEDSESEGVFDHFPFIRFPRPPTVELNQTRNYVWPDLSFSQLRSQEAVNVNVDRIAEGTLFPYGGGLCTHWEFLAAAAAEPKSVATWVPVEDPDRDGRPLWFIPAAENPLILPLHLSVGHLAPKLNLEVVWSVFSPDDPFGTSSRFAYRSIRALDRETRLWGPSRSGFFAANMWGREAKRAAVSIKAAFLCEEECPDLDVDLQRRCLGHPGRDDRIYRAYRGTSVAGPYVPLLHFTGVSLAASNCGREFWPGFGRGSCGNLPFAGRVPRCYYPT